MFARLPFHFDAKALREDLAALDASWQPHFNEGVYEGDWSGVALRSNGGRDALYPDPHGSPFEETPAFAQCASVREVLAQLGFSYNGIRLLKLAPGARIRPHQDYGLDSEGGEARLHVCVQTNPRVSFFLEEQRVPIEEGECWYIDVSRTHSVVNDGDTPRIHLVIDCVLDERLKALIA